MSVRLLALLGLLVALAAAFPADRGEFERWEAIEDSLRQMPPRLRGRWLRDRGIEDPMLRPAVLSTDSGLSVVGRWSLGPAYDVDCRMTSTDTFIALARGSGVSIARLNRSTSTRFEVLSDINCDRLVGDVRLLDTLVLVSSYGLEVWGISDPTRPNRHSRIETDLLGFDARDSLVYTVGYDSFQVISVADPANPRLVGACRDSGSAVSVAGNTAFVANVAGLFAIDVSNPAAPHRVGSWGGQILSVAARGNICCVTQTNPNQPSWLGFTILNTTNPAAITPLGSLNNVGGYDICLDGNRAMLSGYQSGGHEFRLVDIGDSTQPAVVGTCATQNNNYGVWGTTAGRVALVADNRGGLAVIDIANQTQPSLDTVVLRGGSAVDISIDAGLGYVASDGAGLKVLDLSSPASPQWIGDLDTTHNDLTIEAAVALDSFAFIGWRRPYLRVVNVTDPTRPLMAAGCNVVAAPKALALRDSLLYLAADGVFDIVNVARPRQPQVVGTVNLPDRTRNMFLRDTLAYVAQGYSGLKILSVAQPSSPREVGTYASVRSTHGVWVEDTLAYIAEFDSGLTVVSVARPDSCYKVGSRLTPAWAYDVEVSGNSAFVSCRDGLRQFNISNPRSPVEVAFAGTPSFGWRVECDGRYIYLACMDAGVAVYETVSSAIAEPRSATSAKPLRLWPNPALDILNVELLDKPGPITLRILDVAGREVRRAAVVQSAGVGHAAIPVGDLPSGVYVVEYKQAGGQSKRQQFVKP
ncbi:MAG: T9SS type A sorting domain-containing protein [bacterium]